MLLLDKETFEAEVLAGAGTILVDFFGDGCEPCKALLPAIEELAVKYGDAIKFTKLNTTAARRLAISQGILGLPVIAIYRGGKKVEELAKDAATPENIETMVKKYI